jgi:hypothetical protein
MVMRVFNKTPAERLLLKSKEMPSGCREWQGSRFMSRGKPTYGQMWYQGTNTKAHRVAWKEFKGPIPDGKQVLHKCDNPLCVNPEHLFLGDNTVNVRDCIKKGRKVVFPGESNGKSKLTRKQVRAIRRDTRIHEAIAADYGVCRANISVIKSRKKWAWLL